MIEAPQPMPASVRTDLKDTPRSAKILRDAEESIAERLVEDAALVRRYVLRELITLTTQVQHFASVSY